jgi:hypothetical protein
MTRRGRLLGAYRRGIRDARAKMQSDLDETRVSLERELATLRSAVKEVRLELERARSIDLAVEAKRDDGFRRLQ